MECFLAQSSPVTAWKVSGRRRSREWGGVEGGGLIVYLFHMFMYMDRKMIGGCAAIPQLRCYELSLFGGSIRNTPGKSLSYDKVRCFILILYQMGQS